MSQAMKFVESIMGIQMKGGGGKGSVFSKKLDKRKDVRSPEGLGAFLGRKKQGKSNFQAKAAKARHGK